MVIIWWNSLVISRKLLPLLIFTDTAPRRVSTISGKKKSPDKDCSQKSGNPLFSQCPGLHIVERTLPRYAWREMSELKGDGTEDVLTVGHSPPLTASWSPPSCKSGNRKWWQQTGSRQSTPPIDDTDPIWKFSIGPGSYTDLRNPAEFSPKEKPIQKFSIDSTSSIRTRLRTPFLRAPFPRLLAKVRSDPGKPNQRKACS